jgi:hypothetical protein
MYAATADRSDLASASAELLQAELARADLMQRAVEGEAVRAEELAEAERDVRRAEWCLMKLQAAERGLFRIDGRTR